MSGALIKRIEEIERATDPRRMARETYDFFRKETPIKTGNARRNTKLQNDEIQAQYPYAVRLDQGYSRQAPNGMTEPTEKFWENYIKKQVE